MKLRNIGSDKIRLLAGVTALVFLITAVGFGLISVVHSVSPNTVMATVDQTRIRRRDVDRWMGILKIIYGPEIDSPDTRDTVLSQLIEETLLLQAAAKRNIEPDGDRLASMTAEIRGVLAGRCGGDEELAKAMKEYGIVDDDLSYLARRALMLEELYLQVTADAVCTDDEALEYYETHRAEFEIPVMVRASHILLETEAAAQEVLELLRAGGDFAELAVEHSTDVYSAMMGGDLGFFSRGQMVPEFEEAVFSLAIGAISGVVETQYGYHVIRLEDRSEARELSFAEVALDIKEYLRQEKAEEVFSQFLEDLMADASVKRRNP